MKRTELIMGAIVVREDLEDNWQIRQSQISDPPRMLGFPNLMADTRELAAGLDSSKELTVNVTAKCDP